MAANGKQGRNKRNNYKDGTQETTARVIDDLIEFDQFKSTILPQLRKMLLENWSSDKIRKHFAPMIQASVVQKALQGDFRAQKDVLDRHEGMAVQRVEQKTVHAQMGNKELAAFALQKFKDAGIIDTTGKVIKDVTKLED